jgi:hypothetical protein
MFKYEMGSQVKDQITGFEGIITARHEFINGCKQYSVEGKVGSDNDTKGFSFDEERLEVSGETKKIAAEPSGGPTGPARSAVRR